MSISGYLDAITISDGINAFAVGWARDSSTPELRPIIEIMIDDVIAGAVVGNLPRRDLVEEKLEDGLYGFKYLIPEKYYDGAVHTVRSRIRGSDLYLNGIQNFQLRAKISEIEEAKASNLVWSGKSFELANSALLDPTTWLGAIQRNVIESPVATSFPRSNWHREDAVNFVCALLMIKNEEDIIYQNLCWLYYLGVRKFVILNNNSDDFTEILVKKFERLYADTEILLISDPIARYIQSQKMTGIMSLAANVWPDCTWMIPVDADEFLVAERGLRALENIHPSVDAIVIAKCYHYVLESKDVDVSFESNTFRRMPLRTEKHRAPPKVINRIGRHYRIGPGNHYLIPATDGGTIRYSSGSECDFYYREFSIRSFQQFKKKVVDGGIAIEKAEELGLNVGGSHWKYRYAGYLAGGDGWLTEAYKKEFVKIPSVNFIEDEFPVSSILRSCGLY